MRVNPRSRVQTLLPKSKPNLSFNRFHYFTVAVSAILLRPVAKSLALTYRLIKLTSWVPGKVVCYKMNGYHTEANDFFTREYLKTVRTARDLFFAPSLGISAFKDFIHGNCQRTQQPLASEKKYLNEKVTYTESFQQFSSDLHGIKTFKVIKPNCISSFRAASDGSLRTVMASHFLKANTMAINFGTPNVASFLTKEEEGKINTYKVDAKSLYRQPSNYHATNGKMQSGIFMVPTDLPEEALKRFEEAAKAMDGSKNITCVNTNCRVLKQAGFSIEGIDLDKVVFPNTFMAHLLFRKVFYTDSKGHKTQVHFDIINTTSKDLEEYFDEVDLAVIGTRLRHKKRNSDTPENQKVRSEAGKAIIAAEKKLIGENENKVEEKPSSNLMHRVTISVPSTLGNAVAQVWGRHTIYELELNKAQQRRVATCFRAAPLLPFASKKSSLFTKLKKNVFFSGPAIRFLRRHMMGRADRLVLTTDHLMRHLKSVKETKFNYVLLEDKIVIAKIEQGKKEAHRQAADWALSKHALLSGRRPVHCSGELWYDESQEKFVVNDDSGTYQPDQQRGQEFAELANEFLERKGLFVAKTSSNQV